MSRPRDDEALMTALRRLADLLDRIDSDRATEVRRLGAKLDTDRDDFWRNLNDNRWWAGAGSLAAETMADNPGLPGELWRMETREFRELLIEIGEILMARGGENPGISSWILAFRNWNALDL
jgi:hypothetical protein